MTTYQTDYYISTTEPTAGWLSTKNIDAVLGTTPRTGARPPLAYWQPPKTVMRPDGLLSEIGLPSVVWKFGVLPMTQYVNLRALFATGPSVPIWFRTRDAANSYAFANFTGIAHRPQDDSKRQIGDKFVGVELLITHVESYTALDPTATGYITGVTAVRTAGIAGDPDVIAVTVTAFQPTTVSVTGDGGISGGGACVVPTTVFTFSGTFAADGTTTVTDTSSDGYTPISAGW